MAAKVIAFGSKKGGVGKSTLGVSTAVALAGEGNSVMLVDSDMQGSMAKWHSYRPEDCNLPKLHCVQKFGEVFSTIQELSKHYDYVICDSAGRDSEEFRSSICIADVLVTPFRPSQPDLDTAVLTAEVIKSAKGINPKLSVLAVVNASSTNPKVNEFGESCEFLSHFPEFQIYERPIGFRKVYCDSMAEGLGVTEMDNEKARDEVIALLEEIKKHA